MDSENYRRYKAKEYCDLRESQYSILGSVKGFAVNTAKNFLMNRARKKVAKGTAGILANKTGLSQSQAEGMVNGIGRMTGATAAIKSGLKQGGLKGVMKVTGENMRSLNESAKENLGVDVGGGINKAKGFFGKVKDEVSNAFSTSAPNTTKSSTGTSGSSSSSTSNSNPNSTSAPNTTQST